VNAYDEVLYVGHPFANTHPDRLATIATLHGIDAAPVPTCRVLEIGCGDGANIIPMAATLPAAQFLGIDYAARPVARARQMVQDLELRNIAIMQMDLRDIPVDCGSFDYIIVHGVYSWIPLEVRRHLMPVIARHLAPNGIALVSYNVLPGCRIRQGLWDLLRYHTRNIPDLKSRLAEVRSLIAKLGEEGDRPDAEESLMLSEIRHLADHPDGALCHDDLGETNDPVHFHEFVADAAGSGLNFLAEADLNTMAAGGYAPAMHDALSKMDRLTREQYLDFLRFRRFRSSLLCHAEVRTEFELLPERVAGMHVSPTLLARSRAKGDREPPLDNADAHAIVELLFARWPQTVPVAEIATMIAGSQARPAAPQSTKNFLDSVILGLYISRVVDLRTRPIVPVLAAGERPSVFAPARWISRDVDIVPNLYHEGIFLGDAVARHVVSLLDGRRTRAELMTTLGALCAGPSGADKLEKALAMLAQRALFEA